jgi:hypothetical protein
MNPKHRMERIIIHQACGPSHQSSLYKGNQLLPLPLTNITTFLKNFTTSPLQERKPNHGQEEEQEQLTASFTCTPTQPPALIRFMVPLQLLRISYFSHCTRSHLRLHCALPPPPFLKGTFAYI